MVKLCSACLLGINCRYDLKSNANEKVIALAEKEVLIPVCPEQLGGQSTPRPNAEIVNGSGEDVLDGKAKVIEEDGKEVTEDFIKGAKEVLKIAKLYNVKEAIMVQKSPSCGCGLIYDGTFTRTKREGNGVTTALLKRNEIKVISQNEI